MLEKKISRLVHIMGKYNLIKEEDEEEYVYALICIVELIITLGSILILSVVSGNFVPTIGFLLSFFSLRKRTGGYHLNTFGHCYTATLLLYGLVVVVCPLIVPYARQLVGCTIIFSAFIFIFGTVNHPNIHMNPKELVYSKLSARLNLTLQIAILLFGFWIKAESEIVIYLSFAIILCTFLLILAKITGQEVKESEGNNQDSTRVGGESGTS